uniref:Uncharacterized protein LOC100175067 n=1 Tax=Phallusia mammillata TaxID=59560 RepID=A0A6F9DGW8_9ASCI|nr:uncharacterized protein LOC100175067 [Phallusia mammillata]
MSNSGVMLSGWLRKSPPERKLRRNAWKKRWFVLRSGRLSGDPNVLEYFRHQGSKKPIRAISLNECSQIDANVPVKYEKKDPTHQYVFDIVTKSRTYYLVADTSLEMASWVRYLCDLCGFNHDSPENQADLGSQQQTFKAVQPITGRNYPPNMNEALLSNEEGVPLGSEVPIPLPRPQNTITRRSVPIQSEPTDANGNIPDHEKNLVDGSTSTSSSASARVSIAGTPDNARKTLGEKNGYSFAIDPSLQVSSSEYVLLADCNTAPVSEDPPDDPSLLHAKFCERRTSTDSVFTHDGATSDCASDVLLDQPASSHAHLRYISANTKKQRLDSMPDVPPPQPPNKASNRPMISRVDEMGYSYPPDDDDDVEDIREARKRSVPASYGLSPIDDSEIKRVPLNIQQEYRVDEMGNPLPDGARSGSFLSTTRNSSAATGTEYINTADASSEAGFGNYPGSQRYPIAGKPFTSPTNRTASSQYSASSVFFTGTTPQSESSTYSFPRQIYDVPKHASPQQQQNNNFAHYSSPRNHGQLYNSKNSLYSSATVLSPPSLNNSSPQRLHNGGFAMNSNSGLPRMRRSSSVGQLETVANELAAKTSDYSTPTHMRRRSIDHRQTPIYNVPSNQPFNDSGIYSSPTRFANGGGDFRSKSGAPPPRPPKSEATVKQSMNDNRGSSTSTDRSGDPPVSPVHTAVISTDVPDSPQHTEVVTIFNDYQADLKVSPTLGESPSPAHSSIVKTVPLLSPTDQTPNNKTPAAASTSYSPRLSPSQVEKGARSVNSSCSSGSGTTSDSSRSRSPVTSLYDIPKSRLQTSESGKLADFNDPVNLYDTPRSNSVSEPNSGQRRLAEIEDSKHQSYEPMMNQTDSFLHERIDDTSLYTSMAGAPALIGHSPISVSSRSPTEQLANQKPPPVKRDLKPGRCSLGSDGGTNDNRSYPLRTSGDDSLLMGSDVSSLNSSSHLSDSGPVSPPHTVLMHSLPPSPAVIRSSGHNTLPTAAHTDRLYPPERPPKNPSQSSLSPRTPPSAAMVTGRPYAYTQERVHKPMYDGRHKGSVGGPGVPGRPPKPYNMKSGSGNTREDFAHAQRIRDYANAPARPPKSAFQPNEFEASHFSTVPPAPHQPEKELKYVELTSFPQPQDGTPRYETPPSANDRPPKTGEGVQYIMIDENKTKALKMMKEEREKEQSKHMRPLETKNIKTLK